MTVSLQLLAKKNEDVSLALGNRFINDKRKTAPRNFFRRK